MQLRKVNLSLPTLQIDKERIYDEVIRTSQELLEVIRTYLSKVTSFLKRLVRKIFIKESPEGELRQIQTSERKRRLPNLRNSKAAKALLFIIIIVVSVFSLGKLIGSLRTTKGTTQIEIGGAKARQDIGKEFTFPLRDSEGESLSDIKFFIDKVEKRDEIVVQGKRATSVVGRTFLIVSLKITNQYKQSIKMNTKDYIRLSVNGNEDEWLAPDIHNDPVEIQAISTKLTRVGFPINDLDKNLALRVGEINGDKEIITLDLK